MGEQSLRGYEENRIYITCTRCLRVIDFCDGEAKWLVDRYADQEFIITQPIYNIQEPTFPRTTLEMRAWYWGMEIRRPGHLIINDLSS